MKTYKLTTLIAIIILLSACQSATSTPITQPSETSLPTATLAATLAPTSTAIPTATTVPPTPTPIPGKVVIPITSMKNTAPWLAHAYDPNAQPGTMLYAFNTTKPPFDNKLVRQAFAAAVDREAIAAIATRLYAKNVQPATTLLPPQILGRYLYNEVGIPFDPARARELLVEAGYSDVTSFPKTTLYVSASRSDAPGIYQQTADAIVEMWKEHLGINVTVKSIGYISDLAAYLLNNPNGYEIYRMGFLCNAAEYMDPTCVIETFSSNEGLNGGFNYAHFSNPEFDKLLVRARMERDPAKRQILYIDAERILCEDQAGIIPLYYWTVP